jgi:RNA polymerase sigma factor (sigma-70 family)
MIEEYPVKFLRLLKQDPFMDLDSLHDAIVALESHPPGGIESLPGFLCGRTQLREIDQSRQRRRFLADSEEAIRGQLSKENDPLKDLDEAERREEVDDMMKLLSQDQREILQMVYFDELQQTEIATKLNCSPQSVHTRLSRAKKNLERLLTQRWHGKEFQ